MILVTGGCGFIGHHLVRALLDDGEQVRIIDNNTRGDKMVRGAEYLSGDIRDGVMDLSNIDEVIHLAYINGTPNFYSRPDEVLDVAVKGMLNVISACRCYSVRKLILMSSSEVCRAKLVDTEEAIPLVIPDPFNPRYSYSAGKIISEMLAIHNAKLFDRLLIARPFNIYGPGMQSGHVIPDFIKRISDNPLVTNLEILGSGKETRSFCYIDDFIKGFMLMREKGEHMGIYNIGINLETTIEDLAKAIAFTLGREITVKSGGKLREGDAPRRKPDISKLAALGYMPMVNLSEGLRRMMT